MTSSPDSDVPIPSDETAAARKVTATVWVGRILSAAVSLMLGMSGAMKLIGGGPDMEEGLRHIGMTPSMMTPLGILELTCVVLYLIPHTAVVGAILLTGYMGGAICTHWRVGDPFVVQTVIPIIVWLGLYLREQRLREILPLRR